MKRSLPFLAIIICTVCFAQISKKEIVRTYHKNGRLFTETEMENGMMNGIQNIYNDNGNILYKQFFRNDMLTDSFYQYKNNEAHDLQVVGYVIPISRFVVLDYPTIRTIGITDFKAKNEGDGLVKVFYENGNVQSVSECSNSKKNGAHILYYSNGNIKAVEHYKNGVKIPPIIEFDTTGKVINNEPIK